MAEISLNIKTTRFIRDEIIPRLDQIHLSSGNTGTDHTHPNKDFLDRLNIDSETRLTYDDQVLPIPVVEDTW